MKDENMASIYKRGKKFRATIRIKDGKSLSKSFDTKILALKWAEETEHSLKRKKGLMLGKTLREALDKYAVERAPKNKGEQWELLRIEAFKKKPIADILLMDLDVSDIQEFVDETTERTSAGTSRREFNVLRAVIRECFNKWSWIDNNPCDAVELPPPPPDRYRRIHIEEQHQVLSALKFSPEGKRINAWWSAVAFQIAIETAMRKGEIMKGDWQNVHLHRRFVHLPETKNGTSRNVPLSKKALDLYHLIGPSKKGPIFPVNYSSCEVDFRRRIKQAGIKDLTFHDTRHEAMTQLSRKVDILTLARISGHKDLKSLMIYYNPTPEEMAEMLD